MKSIIISICVFLFVGCQSTSIVEQSKFKTLMIKADGEVETLPNMASFYIDLSCLDLSITESKKCLEDKSNELTKKLLSYNIKKEDIMTTAITLNKSYKWVNNSRVFEGYRSTTQTIVTVRDLEKLSIIYSDLLENKNLTLGGLNYSHSDLDSLKNEAYVKALEKADVLADKLLSKLPENSKEVLKIGNVKISSSLPNQQNEEVVEESSRMYAMNDMKNTGISINTGTIKINATLFVEYQIKK